MRISLRYYLCFYLIVTVVFYFDVRSASAGANCPPGVTIDTETDATQPSDRTRTKIGVGEKVKLTLNPSPSSTVTWAIASGNGSLSSQSGNPVSFTAHEQADNPKITASYDGYTCEVTFEVVEPSSVTMEFLAGSGSAPPLYVWMQTKVYIGPDDVSFEEIEAVAEGICLPTCTGYFDLPAFWSHVHIPGEDTTVTSSLISGKGWKLYDTDLVSANTYGEPYSNGTFIWNIPWHYEINGNEHEFEIVDNVITLTAWPWWNGYAELEVAKASASNTYP